MSNWNDETASPRPTRERASWRCASRVPLLPDCIRPPPRRGRRRPIRCAANLWWQRPILQGLPPHLDWAAASSPPPPLRKHVAATPLRTIHTSSGSGPESGSSTFTGLPLNVNHDMLQASPSRSSGVSGRSRARRVCATSCNAAPRNTLSREL